MERLRGVVIGCGNFGTQEMRALVSLKDVELLAGADVNEERRRAAKKEFNIPVFKDYREALELEPDFAYVSSVNRFHREHVVEAARRGIHIFCEKPIALNLKDADAMVKAVKKSGVKAVVAFGLRFSPLNIKIHRMLEKKELGEIISVWFNKIRGYGLSRHLAVLKPELSGGWIIHHAIHAADWFLWNFGPVKEVCCETASTLKGKGREEIVWASVRFTSGALGSFYESLGASRFHNQGIVGTKGTLIGGASCAPAVVGKPLAYTGTEALLFGETPVRAAGKKRTDGRRRGMIQHEIGHQPFYQITRKIKATGSWSRAVLARAFMDCIRGKRPVWAGMEEGREALRVTLAMRKSAWEHRPVKISEIK